MSPLSNALLVTILLLDLFVLGASRIRALIRAVALQGVLLSPLPLLLEERLGWRVLLLCLATIAIKGLFIPGMLARALDQVHIKREVEPVIGFLPSMMLGALGMGLAIAFAGNLPLFPAHAETLVVPAALSTLLAGFLLMITRIKAVTQVVGYLVLENGVFLFGTLLHEAMPMAVELGVLLDLLVAVFVIQIILHHISREFASYDTRRLSSLKE